LGVRIKLSGGDELFVSWTLDEASKALRDALRHDALLEIEQHDGTIVVVNPRQVQHVSEVQNGPRPAAVRAVVPAGGGAAVRSH